MNDTLSSSGMNYTFSSSGVMNFNSTECNSIVSEFASNCVLNGFLNWGSNFRNCMWCYLTVVWICVDLYDLYNALRSESSHE